MGVITSSDNFQFADFLKADSELISFVDGSWKIRGDRCVSGMGGLIFNQKGEAIFSFAGPTPANSPLEAECAAAKFLLESFGKSLWKNASLLVYSDSMELIRQIWDFQLKNTVAQHFDFPDFIRFAKLKFRHLDSHWNSRADYLAKSGAKRQQVNSYWVEKM